VYLAELPDRDVDGLLVSTGDLIRMFGACAGYDQDRFRKIVHRGMKILRDVMLGLKQPSGGEGPVRVAKRRKRKKEGA
jgi:hypothetical protein